MEQKNGLNNFNEKKARRGFLRVGVVGERLIFEFSLFVNSRMHKSYLVDVSKREGRCFFRKSLILGRGESKLNKKAKVGTFHSLEF